MSDCTVQAGFYFDPLADAPLAVLSCPGKGGEACIHTAVHINTDCTDRYKILSSSPFTFYNKRGLVLPWRPCQYHRPTGK